jgi:hypothetical protein
LSEQQRRHIVGVRGSFNLTARTMNMNIVKGLDNPVRQQSSDLEDAQDCMELLKLARIHSERGQKEEAEQFYAALVQVLRPQHFAAELQI